jgi:hypothetical protein
VAIKNISFKTFTAKKTFQHYMDAEEITTLRKILREELAEMLNIRGSSRATVPLRFAAEVCNVQYKWLLERVQRGEIPAYRPDPASSWRVYVSDINIFLTRTSNFGVSHSRTKKALGRLYEFI